MIEYSCRISIYLSLTRINRRKKKKIYFFFRLPTPVSALIHAATMVTAGVYLLMRSSPLIEYSSTVLLLTLWIGAITTVFSSLIGLFQQDIKKVIAYSTMSQLAREHKIKLLFFFKKKIIFFRYMFGHQTIYAEFIYKYFISINNSQITKALNYVYNYISNNLLNSFSIKKIKRLFVYNIYSIREKWKIIIISKLVGISEAIRLILITYFIYLSNKKENFFFYLHNTLLKFNSDSINKDVDIISEKKTHMVENTKFFEWLAGVIDGDGYFNLSKKGIARFTIVMDIRDKAALTHIQDKLGGSIYKISNANALRYQLTSKKKLIWLINNINGLIRNPTRLLQMNKLCVKYNITLIYPKPLTFNNGWLSGFIDSDGSVYVNSLSKQIFIGISQKNMYLLKPLIEIYGGRVDAIGAEIEGFKYIIYRKAELFNLIDNYFTKYPLKSKKSLRVALIKEFYVSRLYMKDNDSFKLNKWVKWKDKWDKYSN